MNLAESSEAVSVSSRPMSSVTKMYTKRQKNNKKTRTKIVQTGMSQSNRRTIQRRVIKDKLPLNAQLTTAQEDKLRDRQHCCMLEKEAEAIPLSTYIDTTAQREHIAGIMKTAKTVSSVEVKKIGCISVDTSNTCTKE